MSFAGQCARSVSLTVWSWSTIPVSFMSKRRLFGKYGELCISSMLQDAFGDLILVPNSKTTERLPEKLAERRGKRLAATAFVC